MFRKIIQNLLYFFRFYQVLLVGLLYKQIERKKQEFMFKMHKDRFVLQESVLLRCRAWRENQTSDDSVCYSPMRSTCILFDLKVVTVTCLF